MEDASRFDEVTSGGLFVAIAAAGAGSALELAVGIPAVAAIAGVAFQATANLAGRAIEQRQRRAATALQHAADAAAIEPDELVKLLINDGSARLELAMQALEAAARSAVDAKIYALGNALATGALAADDALVDEGPHIKLLQIMAKPRIPSPDGEPYRKAYRDWPPRDLGRQYPQAQPVMGAILAVLTACGAVLTTSRAAPDGGTTYEITEFGRLLLARIRAAEETGAAPR
jgi:hypothetical protein